MFTIKIDFLECQPTKASYSKMSLDQIYSFLSWETNLIVAYNNQVLFSEEVAIIEFYWYLAKWYRRYLAGNIEPFIYSTVEHTDPILVFLPQQNRYWKVDSVWKRYDKSTLIKEQELCSEVHKLLEEIKVVIED